MNMEHKKSRYSYIRDPKKIYEESFRLIRSAVDLSACPPEEARLIERLIHTNGHPEIRKSLHISQQAIQQGIRALLSGAPVLCDTTMVAAGITKKMLPLENPTLCFLDQTSTCNQGKETRSAQAVELWFPHIKGAVIAIGNAPTALYRLLEKLHEGWPEPALIIAMPVGFVSAAESKQALLEDFPHLPVISLTGRDGGSAYAACTVNLLSSLSG